MIAEKEIVDIKPVEKAPTTVEERPPVVESLAQPEWSTGLLIASNICLLAGLLIMATTLMLPISTTLSLVLLITEVSLFVVGAILFALGFVWPKIK